MLGTILQHEVVELDVRDADKVARAMRKTGVFTEDEVFCASTMFSQCRAECSPCVVRFSGVMDSDQVLKGFVCFGSTPLAEGSFDIYWLAVDPSFQGGGIGSVLVEHVYQTARAAGARQLIVETSSSNKYEVGHAVYRHLGFIEVARIPDYYRPGDDRIVLVRKVADNV